MYRFGKSLKTLSVPAVLLTVGALSNSVKGEEGYRITNDVVLTDVRVAHLMLGNRAQIRFVLENRGVDRILFRGITVIGALNSQTVASIGNGATATINSIPIAPGEVLSADGEALWIEVEGLPNLSCGTVKATVHLGEAVIPINFTTQRGCNSSS
jgi:hypothetical protein